MYLATCTFNVEQDIYTVHTRVVGYCSSVTKASIDKHARNEAQHVRQIDDQFSGWEK